AFEFDIIVIWVNKWSLTHLKSSSESKCLPGHTASARPLPLNLQLSNSSLQQRGTYNSE
ncbi:95_t:CDS:1, partial [Gigaspora margarita]